MATRATRSQQKASDKANASPARSTRSGGRSVSPASLSLGLGRASSPASSLRSASPGNTTRNVAAKSARGRGRGRGSTHSSSPQKADVAMPTTSGSTSPRGRGRGRGKGRGRGRGRGKLVTADSLVDEVVASEEPENLNESTDNAILDKTSEIECEVVEKSVNGENAIELESTISPTIDSQPEPGNGEGEGINSLPSDPNPEVLTTTGDDSAVNEITAIATQLVSNTEAEEWTEADADNITFTEEHIKQLESVLSSEGLMLLSTQEESAELNDMSIDDKVIEEGLQADPVAIAVSLESEVEGDAKLDNLSPPNKLPVADPVPRRRSERVTDLERRAQADKIRQENVRKEKEMLKELEAAKEKERLKESEANKEMEMLKELDVNKEKEVLTKTVNTDNAAAASETEKSSKMPSANRSKPPTQSIPKPKISEDKLPKSTTPSKRKSTSQIEKSEGKTKSPKKTSTIEVKPSVVEPVKTPDGSGWIPGKIRVISKQSESSETESQRMKRKSQELKRRLSATAEDLFKPDEPVDVKRPRRRKVKALPTDEVSGGESSSSDSEPPEGDDDEWMEEDDPDQLWCVCRKPHDNRFMICCDRCEEWYHGDCVGISRKRGKQMETQNEEYICSQCKEKEIVEKLGGADKLTVTPLTTSSQAAGDADVPSQSSAEISSSKNAKSGNTTNITKSKDSPVRGEIRKKDASNTSEKKKRFGKFKTNTPRQHCIGSGCDNWAEDNKIYCSLSCIIRHAKESLEIIAQEKSKTIGSKHEEHKNTPNLVVMERHTGRLVTGAHAPSAANLISWLTKHPSFEVLRPGQQSGHVSSSSSHRKQKSKLLSTGDEKTANRRTSSTKEEQPSTHTKRPSGPDPHTIRANVRKSLNDILLERSKEISGFEISDEEIKTIVSSIEHELHKYYGDTNQKYKSKYRSIIFNVRDPKNKGLAQKIIRKKLKPSKLVRMTPDEMASKELHQWREKEIQSELEKIRADEERKAAANPVLRKMTHKGEVEVVQETFPDLNIKLEEGLKNYDMDSKASTSLRSPKYSTKDDLSSRSENSVDVLSSLMGSAADTTSQHDAHLFDINCKICTGKQTAPTGAELERRNSNKKLKIGFEASTSQSMAKPRESSREEIDKVIKAELKDLEKEIKVFKEEDKAAAQKIESKRRKVQIEETKNRVKFDNSPKQEPSSTVLSPYSPTTDLSSPTPVVSKKKHQPSAWKGFIDVPEVSKFFTTAHGVHGNSDSLKSDLPDSLQIVGRIHPSQVWEYISQLKHTISREVILVRFSAVNEEEKIGYKEYFKYLSEKKRFGVVGNGASTIKDMYIIPLPSHESLPAALKPYRHKVLADDNRPNMLVGLVVRTKVKKSQENSQAVRSEEDEPYEPPGLGDIIPAEPETPSPKDTSQPVEPLLGINSVEEYDPTKPLVAPTAPAKSHTDMDVDGEEPYDPIVSAYSLADAEMLNAEDAPGAAPYSPGQEDMDTTEQVVDSKSNSKLNSEPYKPEDEGGYDPADPVISVPSTSSKHTSSPSALPEDSELTAQQLALKRLTMQVELQRLELEKKKALLAAQPPLPPPSNSPTHRILAQPPSLPPPLPKTFPDIASDKISPDSSLDSKLSNFMDSYHRTVAKRSVVSVLSAPPPPPDRSHTMEPDSYESADRPKISFPLQGHRNKPQVLQKPPEEEEPTRRPYLPPPTQHHGSSESRPHLPLPHKPLLPPQPAHLRSHEFAEAPSSRHLPRGPYDNPHHDSRAFSQSDRSSYPPPHREHSREFYRDGYNRDRGYDDRSNWQGDYDYRDNWTGNNYDGRDRYQRPPPRQGDGYSHRGRHPGGYGYNDGYHRRNY